MVLAVWDYIDNFNILYFMAFRTERRIGMFTLMIYAIVCSFMKLPVSDISNETRVICSVIFLASDLNILLTTLIKIAELKGEAE